MDSLDLDFFSVRSRDFALCIYYEGRRAELAWRRTRILKKMKNEKRETKNKNLNEKRKTKKEKRKTRMKTKYEEPVKQNHTYYMSKKSKRTR